jgi:DNA-binding FadR family transcriptional regulator
LIIGKDTLYGAGGDTMTGSHDGMTYDPIARQQYEIKAAMAASEIVKCDPEQRRKFEKYTLHIEAFLESLSKGIALADKTARVDLLDLWAMADRELHLWLPQFAKLGNAGQRVGELIMANGSPFEALKHLTYNDMCEIVEEHRCICDAIRKGSHNEIVSAICAHLKKAQQRRDYSVAAYAFGGG